MVINITTWSPDTCKCELSYSWDSDVPQEKREHIFYAVHKVCDVHSALATQKHAILADAESARLHHERSELKRAQLNQILENNMSRHFKLLADANTKRDKKDLESMTGQVEAHNFRVLEMFNDILSAPFAHDENIYAVIMDENQTKNIASDDLKKQVGKDVDIKWELRGEAPNRVVYLTSPNGVPSTLAKKKYACQVVIQPALTH